MITEQAPQAFVPRTTTEAPTRHARRLPRTWLASGLLVALAILGIVGYQALHGRSAPTVHTETMLVTRGPIAAKVTASGTLSALVMVSVGSQVSGRIATLGADFGSHVKTGQVVATIEPSLLRAAAQQARANVAAADAAVERAIAQRENLSRTFERVRLLAQQQYTAQADLDSAEASLRMARAETTAARATADQARAALAQAELNLRYTTIVSPIDGVVISRNVDVGQTVAAMLQAPTLFTIAQDLTRMQVDTSVPEADIGKVTEGMAVTFSVDAHPGRTFAGHVRQVRDNAQTQQNVVTYDAVIDVENTEHLLKPGMTASVTFVYARRDDAVRIPNAALRFRPDARALAAWQQQTSIEVAANERVAWSMRDGRVQPMALKLGIRDGTWTEVLSENAHAGDRFVTEASALP